MFEPGDVILATVQFTDTFEIKTRPAVIIFEELGNIIIAGITSNTEMKGVILNKKDGVVKDSVIKTNYLFTISDIMIKKKLFSLSKQKKLELYNNLIKNLSVLKE